MFLKDGEAVYVLLFSEIASLLETSSGMKMKILKKKGEKELLKLCKDPLELYTLVAGDVSIMKEIGAEVITDGFFKDEGMVLASVFLSSMNSIRVSPTVRTSHTPDL